MTNAFWVGPTALDDWRRERAGGPAGRDIDVVLITHPRDEHDLPRLFPSTAELSPAQRRVLIRHLRPTFGEVIETPEVCVAVLFLPFLADELMDWSRLRAARRILAVEGLRMAAASGARIVCLGGLTAAVSGYGRQLWAPARELGLTVTTGHAATAISVARTLQRATQTRSGELAGSRLTVLGAGSSGGTVARLLATQDDQPDEFVLVDRPHAGGRVESIAAEIRESAGTPVRVELTGEDGVLSPASAAYRSDYVISAVSLPNVVEIARLAPGTALVDDGQPYCWSREDAWTRFEKARDILPCEAGLVDCSSIGYRSHFPFDFADHVGPAGSSVAWSRLAEGLLLALDPVLGPTSGNPDLAQIRSYARAFERFGLRVAPLQCGSHPLPVESFMYSPARARGRASSPEGEIVGSAA